MEDKKVEVFRLDLSHLPSSRSAPKYTGFEDNLYALTKPVVAGVVQQALETDVLQRIDSEAARVLRRINTTGFADLTPEDLRVWVCFIMLLLWRTPDTVSRLHTEAPDHLKISLDERPGEYDSIAENFDPPTLAEWTEEHIPGFIENFGIINLPNSGLQFKHWDEDTEHEVVVVEFQWATKPPVARGSSLHLYGGH